MRTAALILYILFCLVLQAQKTTRRPARHVPRTTAARPDSLGAPWTDSVSVSGFDKKLRSAREQMFVTNSSSRDFSAIRLRISYYDSKGRLLHVADRYVRAELPARGTRLVEIPSFDRNSSFYYYLSRPPRAAGQEFRVTIDPLYLYVSEQ